MSNTLAKAKAASFIQPMAALALTPNVHTQVTPDDAAVIDLHNSSINVLNIVDPAATLAVHVDHDNFAALGGKLFVMHIDSTDACELTLNYVRGNTVLKSQIIAIPANSHTTLTAGSIIQADNQVKLLIVGNQSLAKEATGSPSSSLFDVLTNASYDNNILHYTSGYLIGGAAGMAAQIDSPNGQSINLVVPAVADLVNTSVALTLGPADTAQAYLHQMQTDNATATLSISPFEGSISASLQIDGGEALVIPDVQSGDILRVDFTHNEVAVIHNGTRYSDGPSSRIQPSDPLYALFVLMQNSNGVVPDLSVSEYVNILL